MNRILFTLMLCISVAYGQTLTPGETGKPGALDLTAKTGNWTLSGWGDCGDWKTKTDTSEWVTVDTLDVELRDYMRKHPNTSFDPVVWVYDRIKSMTPFSQSVTLEWNPCKGSESKEEQYRICSITGIRQRREITYKGWYEKSLTEYEKTVKKFTDQKHNHTVYFTLPARMICTIQNCEQAKKFNEEERRAFNEASHTKLSE